MLDLISSYQQCQDLKVDTSLDDLEIKDLEEFEDSLESWDCLDGHVNGHVNSLLAWCDRIGNLHPIKARSFDWLIFVLTK